MYYRFNRLAVQDPPQAFKTDPGSPQVMHHQVFAADESAAQQQWLQYLERVEQLYRAAHPELAARR